MTDILSGTNLIKPIFKKYFQHYVVAQTATVSWLSFKTQNSCTTFKSENCTCNYRLDTYRRMEKIEFPRRIKAQISVLETQTGKKMEKVKT